MLIPNMQPPRLEVGPYPATVEVSRTAGGTYKPFRFIVFVNGEGFIL